MAITLWQAGQRITAGRLNLITPTWSTWTPTWSTTSGVNTPSYGNATVSCEYCQTGDLVIARIEIIFGTTTSFGGGGVGDNWSFSLPVTAASVNNSTGHFELSIGANDRRYGRGRLYSTTTFGLETSSGAVDGGVPTNTGAVDSLTPETWASTNGIYGSLSYRAA